MTVHDLRHLAAAITMIWTVQSVIFPENTASLALHARAGFRIVDTRESIGCHRGQWRDVVLAERHIPTAT